MVVGVVTYALYINSLGLAFLVPLWIFLLMTWILFRMRTWCDYDIGTRGCIKKVNGKLGGCHFHKRLKRDAAWAAVGMRNPGIAFRLTWRNSNQAAGRRAGERNDLNPDGDERRSESTVKQGMYNATMWIFTAVSAVAAIVMPIVVK